MLQKSKINMIKVLGELPLFAQVAPENLGELARASRIATFQREQAIYRVSDPVKEMYVLLSGQVKLALSCNRGNEKIIDVVEAGRSFGEAELFGEPHLIGAFAVRPSQLLCIGGNDLCRVMALDPRVALRIMKLLAQRQVEMEAEFAARRFRSGSRRLLDFFLRLAGPGRDRVGETLVTLGVSKQLLASRFDMQPETLSRSLRDLTDAGLIAVDGCHIRLQNVRIAQRLADDDSGQPIIAPNRRRVPRADENGCAAMASAADARNCRSVSRPLSDTINKAGRQRMLSQRMAKSWLMLERGVLTRQAREVLRQSVDLFERQKNELDTVASSPQSRAASAELSEAWPAYKALLRAEPSRKAARELFSINEEVLAAAQKLTLSFAHADGTRQGRLVDLAGRERMLSQRLAKFFMFQHLGIQVAKCRTGLEDARQEFSTALVELATAARDHPRITTELRRVAEHWKALQSAIVMRDDADFASLAGKVFTTSEDLLRRTDAAVKLYARLPA